MVSRPLVTIAQAAAVLGVSPKTVYSWCDRGYIAVAHVDPNGRKFYDLDELEREASTDRRRAALDAE
jgi:predicted site-specific integrase-resolvase